MSTFNLTGSTTLALTYYVPAGSSAFTISTQGLCFKIPNATTPPTYARPQVSQLTFKTVGTVAKVHTSTRAIAGASVLAFSSPEHALDRKKAKLQSVIQNLTFSQVGNRGFLFRKNKGQGFQFTTTGARTITHAYAVSQSSSLSLTSTGAVKHSYVKSAIANLTLSSTGDANAGKAVTASTTLTFSSAGNVIKNNTPAASANLNFTQIGNVHTTKSLSGASDLAIVSGGYNV